MVFLHFFAQEVGATIFSAKNLKISNDRLGLTRSAILLILFIVIHAVGNLHVFKGHGHNFLFVLSLGLAMFGGAVGNGALGGVSTCKKIPGFSTAKNNLERKK